MGGTFTIKHFREKKQVLKQVRDVSGNLPNIYDEDFQQKAAIFAK